MRAGDLLTKDGKIAKPADQVAKERHRIRTAVTQTSLKGPQPDNVVVDNKIKGAPEKKAAKPTSAPTVKEVEADNRDITIQKEE